jgi:hypothetical protein
MSIDIERLKARNFSGLTDEQMEKFKQAVRHRVGGGKCSYVICQLVLQFVKIHEDSIARQGALDRRVNYAVDNSYKAILGDEVDVTSRPYYNKEGRI